MIQLTHLGRRTRWDKGDWLPVVAPSHQREASHRAFPKKLGAPKLFVDSDTLVGTLDYGSLRIAQATMGYKHQPLAEEDARAEICVPTFMLKLMRGYDRQMRICELVRTQIQDIDIKFAFKGPARLQLFEHVLAPMADFPVREIVAASHILADLSLTPPTGSTRPRKVISPVIATSSRTIRPVAADASAVAMVMPADGPSLGTAPPGT